MTEVSFIIPTYNDEEYINACLKSVCAITNTSVEFIVVDDGSTDKTPKICDYYAKKDSRFRVIHQNNQGVSVARNTGIECSCGRWIFFIDGDDYIYPDVVEKEIIPKLSDDYDIVYFCYDEDIQGNIVSPPNYDQEDLTTMDTRFLLDIQCSIWNRYYKGAKDLIDFGFNVSSPWAKVYRADFIKNNNLWFVPGIIRAQDQLFNAKAFLYTKKICFAFKTGYIYRGRSGKVYSYNRNLLHNLEDLLSAQRAVLAHCKIQEVVVQYKIWLCAHMIQMMRLEFCNPKNPKTYKERLTDFRNTMNIPAIKDAFQNTDLKEAGKSRHIMLWLIKHRWFFLLDLYYRNYKGAALFAIIRKRMDS